MTTSTSAASSASSAAVSAAARRGGRIVSGLAAAFLTWDAVVKVMKLDPVVSAFAEMGWPVDLARAIGVVELACVALYVLPRTSRLGALLLTAYLGGATAAKVRLEDPWFLFSVGFGVLGWVGLWLRDAQLRAIVWAERRPARRAPPLARAGEDALIRA